MHAWFLTDIWKQRTRTYSHPFEIIKRRFYLRNTSASVKDEWERIGGRMRFRVNTVRLDLTLVERGFYDEQVRSPPPALSHL